MNEEQFKKLKREVEETKAAAERAQGAFDQIMKQLKEEYGCKTIREAEKLRDELGEKRDRAEAVFNKSLKAYEKKWKEEE